MGVTGREVAIKTGTTNDSKDAWMMGYTPNLVIGAWAGNNDNSPMDKKVAGYIIAPMWNAFATEVLAGLPDERFTPPNKTPSNLKPVFRGVWQGGESYWTDKVSGKLATDYTPEETKQEHVTQNVHSILYWVDRSNPYGPKPSNPSSDPQFKLWEGPVRRWATQNGYGATGAMTGKPSAFDDVHKPGTGPKFNITSPADDNSFSGNDQINIKLDPKTDSIVEANYYINGQFLGSSKDYPFSFTTSLGSIKNISTTTKNELKVIVYDSIRNNNEQTVQFSAH